MKKIVALTIALILVISLSVTAFAINFDATNHYETEALEAASQGEIAVIEDSSFSDGKAYQLKAAKGEDWISNDYIRFYAPIWQRGWYEIKAKVRKGPDCGIIQFWASDTNLRWGDKIDMYSPKEEVVEVTFAKAMCDIGEGRWFEFRVDGKNTESSGYNFVIDTLEITFVEAYEAPGALYPNYTDKEPIAEADTGYEWGQVMEGGSGRSTHVHFHPTEQGLMYVATDMGGAYRWNDAEKRWTSITDWFPMTGNAWSLGVDGVALDPNNPDIIYLALGTNADKGKDYMGRVVKSYDRGDSWEYTGFEAYFNSNDQDRNQSECIAVDPNNSDVVMCSTMDGRLVRSEDGFKTWRELKVPFETEQNVLCPRSIIFDPTSKDEKGSKTIYLGSTGAGLWVSNDYGESFNRIDGCPISEESKIYTINFSNDGTLLVATNKLYKKDKDGVWTEITPVEGKNFNASNIYPTDSDYMVTAMNYNGPVGSYGEYNYVTTDGGKTWKLLNDIIERVNIIPRVEWNGFFANTTTMSFDPFDKNRVAYTGWQNFYLVEGMLTDTPKISNYTNGLEHGCERKLHSLPVGARLINSAYDFGGGRFTDVTQYMPNMLPSKNSNPTETAFSEGNPNYIVRVGKKAIYYSTDNGMNWKQTESVPASASKEVMCAAVSKDPHPETGWPVIYALYGGSSPEVSIDNGKTWTTSNAPVYKPTSKWGRVTLLTSDKEENNVVYYMDSEGNLYKSTDYGVTYNLLKSLGASDHIETMFGTNHLFVNTSEDKLYYSTNNGEDFTQIGAEFDRIKDFGFGKEEKSGDPAVIYIIAIKDDVYGIYRSQDLGKTWLQIYNDATATDSKFSNPLMITGDRQEFGIVYAGTSGRGIFYGCPDDNNIFFKIRNDDIKVLINGQTVMFDVSPKLIDDRTMVPMRKIFEDVGAKVEWDEATQTVTAKRIVHDMWKEEVTEVKLTIGEKNIYINGEPQEIDVAPVVIDGRTLVPVRFISESLGGIVEWIDESQIVKITM